MANAAKLGGRKGRRPDNKTEIGKADNTLNFALTAGAVGLGLALLDLKQAAAAPASKANVSHDDDRQPDASPPADQAMSGPEHQSVAGAASHGNGVDAELTVTGGEVAVSAASAGNTDGAVETIHQAPEAISLLAATVDAAGMGTAHAEAAGIVPAIHTGSEGSGGLEGGMVPLPILR